MSTATPSVAGQRSARRLRRSHKKSSSGCTNCRYRRVKCDEVRPSCGNCRSYMVSCQYGGVIKELNVVGEQVLKLGKTGASRPQRRAATPEGTLWSNPDLVTPTVNPRHAIILRFQNRTALTLGTVQTRHIYAECVPRLAIEHDFLLHAVLAMTLSHDKALASQTTTASAETRHLSQSVALFNKKLSSVLTASDTDAVWATSVYICAISIFNVGTCDPESAWPLRPSQPDDLEWLHLQAGLKAIWRLAHDPSSTGVFAHVERSSVNCVYPLLPEAGIERLPPILCRLCGLSSLSTASNNPYLTAVQYLAWLLPMNGSSDNILTFMVFAGGMTSHFRQLLHDKDPRALLLLALWYSKLFRAAWWMVPRAALECQAITMYLERLHIQDEAFTEVLGHVKSARLHKDTDTMSVFIDRTRPTDDPSSAAPQDDQSANGPTSKIIGSAFFELIC